MLKNIIIIVLLLNYLGFANSAMAVEEVQPLTFHQKVMRFRFNQGLFDLAGEILIPLLKKIEFISDDNTIQFPREQGDGYHSLQYRDLDIDFHLQPGKIITSVKVYMNNSTFYVKKRGRCRLNLIGPMEFQIETTLNNNGASGIVLVEDTYNDRSLRIIKRGCGFFTSVAINMMVRDKLATSIKEAFDKVFNEQEFLFQEPLSMAQLFKTLNVMINQPNQGFIDETDLLSLNPESFKVMMGVRGQLSNINNSGTVSVFNPMTPYLNRLGFDWAFDAGVEALSQNILDPHYQLGAYDVSYPFPKWGLAPMQRFGVPLDFSVGLMVKERFLIALFESLYQGGFFNMQLQDSLLKWPEVTLNPLRRIEDFQVIQPNGEILSAENFKDARLELQIKEAPEVSFKENNQLVLSIPRFQMNYFVQTQNEASEFAVIKFLAKFNLVAGIEFNNNSELHFVFNKTPLQEFVILERGGIADDLSNDEIKSLLDRDITAILNKVGIEIPLLAGRSISVKYMNIDHVDGNPLQKTLSIYLK